MKLESLAHWNSLNEFTGEEAATLIVGIDLNSIGGRLLSAANPNPKGIAAIPIHKRMSTEYDHSRLWYLHQFNPQDDGYDGPRQESMLSCLAMERLVKFGDSPNTDDRYDFYHWLQDEQRCGFDAQRFGRLEIARWLNATGMRSAYPFDIQAAESLKGSSNRWPWGDHHTPLLGHLEAAARRYWGSGYDPSNNETASTNAMVSEWLQTERKVSRKMADSIATMLRPEGLPTGPRK